MVYYGPAFPDGITFFSKTGPLPGSRQEPHPDDILRGLSRASADTWAHAYRQSEYYRRYVESRRQDSTNKAVLGRNANERLRPPGWLQLWTLVRRCLRIKLRDSWNSAILLAQAPAIALLVVLVFGQRASGDGPAVLQAKPLTLFVTSLAALWFGCSNAVREIVGEWAIYRRERMVGLALWPYVSSKFIVLGSLCLLQCLVLLIINRLGCNWKSEVLPQYVLLVLVALVGLALGLTLSALARTTEVALALLPLVLLPMVVLGGAMMPIHEMPKPMGALTKLMPTRWAYEGLIALEAKPHRIRITIPEPGPIATNPAQAHARHVPVLERPADLSQERDLAETHFPKDQRHEPVQCMLALMILLGLMVGAIIAILRYRDIV